MKNTLNLIALALSLFIYSSVATQTHLLTPPESDVIITIRGEKIFEKMSLQEMKDIPVMNQMFSEISKALEQPERTVDDLGIDINSTAQFFMESEDDGNMMMGLSFKVNNASTFSDIFMADGEITEVAGVKSTVKEGYTFAVSGEKGLITYSVLGAPKYDMIEETEIYYDDSYPDYEIEEAEEPVLNLDMTEEEEIVEQAIEEEAVEYEIEEYVEEVPYEEEFDWEAYYAEEDRKRKEKEAKEAAEVAIVSSAYAKELMAKSIITPLDLSAKMIDNDADFSFLINDYGRLMSQYMNNIYGANAYYMNPVERQMQDMLSGFYGDMEFVAMNGYYDKNEFRVESNAKLRGTTSEMYKGMFDSEINANMLNYIPFDDHIAYMAGALNTENMLNGYYNIYRDLLKAMPADSDMKEFSDYGSIILDFIEMGLDEAAIGNLIQGDFYAGITDINSYEVEYTTYEYDDDWNYKEITKTKEEVRPDFLMMFGSQDEKNINNIFKLINLGSRDEFKDMGGYYKLASGRDIPLDIYAMYEDGIVFVFTSQALFDFVKKGGEKPSSTDKKAITESSYTMKIDGKKLAEKVPLTELPSDMRSMVEYARDNVGDLTLNQSKMKGDILTTEMSLSTEGKHDNSLSYFVNMINEMVNMQSNNNSFRN